jgi:primosomal protein N' (replication factor Y)
MLEKAGLVVMEEGSSALLERRQAIVRMLIREAGPVDVSWIYAESGGSLADLYALQERGLVVFGESEVWRNPLADLDLQPRPAPPLTRDQESVLQAILSSLEKAGSGKEILPILLHGVTGSGKTEIYLRAVEETLARGMQAVILVPEIALTPQTVRRFLSRFPGRVGLQHSALSTGERYDTWRRARAGLISVLVGPRSALFAPFPRLGLIVLDECHDDSYYQGEAEPRYHAVETAIAYARITGAACLLGSATPDVSSVYRASKGGWMYLHLPARILAHREVIQAQIERLSNPGTKAAAPAAEVGPLSHYRPLEGLAETVDLPPVHVVDMRRELQAGNRSIFSRDLQTALGEVLSQGQQAILFLNRRGTATYVFCRNCGFVLKCPHCELPLTYHAANEKLLCHRCGYKRKMPEACPECGSKHIRHYGAGTAKVESEAQALFPQARILRWDAETTQQKGAHEIILGHFTAHRADILVGTQMLAKGLDLPLVTLVGVVLADVGLNLPDYRAAERTFQVLTQVAGRAGRSLLGGKVILQTFQPQHYAVRAASLHDYRSFYQQEILYRRRLGYPPFAQLVRLEFRHSDPELAEREAKNLASKIRSWLEADDRRATQMAGPVPCFYARIAGLYRWQIVLRGPAPASLLRGKQLGEWLVEVNPPNLL